MGHRAATWASSVRDGTPCSVVAFHLRRSRMRADLKTLVGLALLRCGPRTPERWSAWLTRWGRGSRSYNGITSAVMDGLNCDTVSGFSILHAYPSVSCESEECAHHSLLLPLADRCHMRTPCARADRKASYVVYAYLVVVVAGFPLVSGFFLIRRWREPGRGHLDRLQRAWFRFVEDLQFWRISTAPSEQTAAADDDHEPAGPVPMSPAPAAAYPMTRVGRKASSSADSLAAEAEELRSPTARPGAGVRRDTEDVAHNSEDQSSLLYVLIKPYRSAFRCDARLHSVRQRGARGPGALFW